MYDWKKDIDDMVKEVKHYTVLEKCDFCGNWDVLFGRIIDHKPIKLCRNCYDRLKATESGYRAFGGLFLE